MKTTLQIIAILIFIAVLFAATVKSLAAENDLKSMTAAAIMAFDPIPGDALAYAGKPAQAIGSALLGIPGGIVFGYGLYLWVEGMTGNSDDCSELVTGCYDYSELTGWGAFFMITGGALYLPALLWDGIGGISGVRKYNAEIKQKHSLFERVTPMFAVTNGGANVGLQVQF